MQHDESVVDAFVIYLLSYAPRYGLSTWSLCELPFWSTDIVPACNRLWVAEMVDRRPGRHGQWIYKLTPEGRDRIGEACRTYRHWRRQQTTCRRRPSPPHLIFAR